MKYFGGCDVGSTYTKAVILDENGKMLADTTIKSKINSEQSAIAAMDEVLSKVGLKSSKELEYLIGTGYGRNKVPFADENISEISCHAMGVHVTDPTVKAIIDIGGQDVKGIIFNSRKVTCSMSVHGNLLPINGIILEIPNRTTTAISSVGELVMHLIKSVRMIPTMPILPTGALILLLTAATRPTHGVH